MRCIVYKKKLDRDLGARENVEENMYFYNWKRAELANLIHCLNAETFTSRSNYFIIEM